MAVDAALALALAVALASSVGWFFAERAVGTLRIGQPGTLWRGPVPMALGAVGELVYGLPFAWALIGALDPATGATAGKRLLGLRVREDGAEADGAGAGRRGRRWPRWRREAVRSVAAWGWTAALLAGRWEPALAASVAGALVAAGSLLALGPERRALHDRLSGTRVVRAAHGRGTSPA